MDKQDVASLRARVEAKYQDEIKRLDQERQALEKWYTEKTTALDMIAGKKTVDDWLEISAVGAATLPALTGAGYATVSKPKTIKPPINQAEEIRNAIFSIHTNITNALVETWLAANKPDIHPFIQVRSIRSELWRLEKRGRLRIIGKDGNAHIYEVSDEPAESIGTTPSESILEDKVEATPTGLVRRRRIGVPPSEPNLGETN